MVFKKACKVLLGLFIANMIISYILAVIFGESRILTFIPIGFGSYEVRGILASTFFFAILLIIYLLLYPILPIVVTKIRGAFNITKNFIKVQSKLFGERAKIDVELDFSLYLKKITSSIVILCGVIILPVNYLLFSQTQDSLIIGSFFVLVFVSLFFLRRIYTYLSD